jgi:hypothetical protein
MGKSKGQVPVIYIVAIILGIVVIGVIGYGVFVLGWRLPGMGKEQWCKVRQDQYCWDWYRAYQIDNTTTYDIWSGKPENDWGTYASGCSDIGINAPSESYCKTLVGLG